MTNVLEKTFEHQCYFDLSKVGSGTYPYLLEIDFIHADRSPDMGGWALLLNLCRLIGCWDQMTHTSGSSSLTPSGSYVGVRFRSKKDAERAMTCLVAALRMMHEKGIGLRPETRGSDPFMEILMKSQPSVICPAF